MKPISNIIYSSALATSAMTLFSYVVSEKENKNFKEPQLLGTFLRNSCDCQKVIASDRLWKLAGWGLHYGIGLGFAAGYKSFIGLTGAKTSFRNGLLYGALAGVTGILTWQSLFKIHPSPPKTHRTMFYGQLFVAHLIFGLTMSAMEKKRNKLT
jgi:hypothetical protein